MSVSVVIPTRFAADDDGRPYVFRCLDGLAKTAPDAEVLVMVNEADAGWGRALRNLYRIKLGVTPGPFSYPGSINAGAAHASGDLLLLLNDDVEPVDDCPDWLAEMTADLGAGVGVVGATLFHPGGTVQHAGMTVPASGIPAHDFYGRAGYRPHRRTVQAVTGACVLTRRALWEALGGHDDGYSLWFSDVDYCLRARDAGWSTVLSAAFLVHHEYGSEGGARPGDTVRWFASWARRTTTVAESLPPGNPARP